MLAYSENLFGLSDVINLNQTILKNFNNNITEYIALSNKIEQLKIPAKYYKLEKSQTVLIEIDEHDADNIGITHEQQYPKYLKRKTTKKRISVETDIALKTKYRYSDQSGLYHSEGIYFKDFLHYSDSFVQWKQYIDKIYSNENDNVRIGQWNIPKNIPSKVKDQPMRANKRNNLATMWKFSIINYPIKPLFLRSKKPRVE